MQTALRWVLLGGWVVLASAQTPAERHASLFTGRWRVVEGIALPLAVAGDGVTGEEEHRDPQTGHLVATVLQARVTGAREAEGDWYTFWDGERDPARAAEHYRVKLAISADGRTMTITGERAGSAGHERIQVPLYRLDPSPAPSGGGCAEAALFYDAATRAQVYRGGQGLGLRYTRDETVRQFTDALARYRAEPGAPDVYAGSGEIDAPFLCQVLINSASPTGQEAALQRAAAELHGRLGHPLNPGELFYLALKLHGGNVRNALLCAHAATYRNGPSGGSNGAFIATHLEPLRDAAAYNPDDRVVTGRTATAPQTYRQALGGDQQGLWYHLYGMAVVEFQDEAGVVPFAVVRSAAEAVADPDSTAGASLRKLADLAGRSLTSFEEIHRLRGQAIVDALGTELSRYAVQLEHSFRTRQRRPADPDKLCINFTGAAVGAALRRELQLPDAWQRGVANATVDLEPAQFDPERTLDAEFTTPDRYTLSLHCPASLVVRGRHGEVFGLDQTARRLGGNTPWVVVELLPEPDGSLGLVATPLFDVASIELVGTAARGGAVVVYQHATRRCAGRTFTLLPGARATINPAEFVQSTAETVRGWHGGGQRAPADHTLRLGPFRLRLPEGWQRAPEAVERQAGAWVFGHADGPVVTLGQRAYPAPDEAARARLLTALQAQYQRDYPACQARRHPLAGTDTVMLAFRRGDGTQGFVLAACAPGVVHLVHVQTALPAPAPLPPSAAAWLQALDVAP